MTHPRSSKTSGKGRSRLVLGWVGSGAMKIAPKISYGKYEEQYQYVTLFSSDCHGVRIALLSGLSTKDQPNRIRSDQNAGFATCETSNARLPRWQPSRYVFGDNAKNGFDSSKDELQNYVVQGKRRID
jgi:hypothetical protein